MEIGTFARTNVQVDNAIKHSPDFIDLRMDLNYSIIFKDACEKLSNSGIACTLHLPSNPEWKPQNISREITPYIDIGADINAQLVTFHTSLSSIFYSDEDIDAFLDSVVLAHDAARERGIDLAIENLGLYYTELTLLFEKCPSMKIALDIGHGQILASRNRALAIIDSFSDRIEMVNVHDNNGADMIGHLLKLREEREIPPEEIRELGMEYDLHLAIGEGKIEFEPIFKELKERSYDKKFLMMCKDPDIFSQEREKFEKLWLSA